MQNKYFSDVVVERDTRMAQYDKIWMDCLDHIASSSLWGLFVTEI